MKWLFVVVAGLIILAGCANPINRHTAGKYNQAAYAAMKSGDWFGARMYFGRAIQNAKVGGVDTKSMAVLWYEYGRSSGVICDWVEAERGLDEAYKLDSETQGPVYMSLYERGRMHYDRKQYTKAVEYFARTNAEFDKARFNFDTADPLGYADYLEEYSDALEKTGNVNDAKKHRDRAVELRNTFPGKEAHTEKTPYGTQCKLPNS